MPFRPDPTGEDKPPGVTVRSHTRASPKKKPTAATFRPDDGSEVSEDRLTHTPGFTPGGGGDWGEPTETAFGQPIAGRQKVKAGIDVTTDLMAGLASLAVPGVAGPAWLARAAKGARFAGPAVKALPGTLARAGAAGSAGAATKTGLELGAGAPLTNPLETFATQAALSGGGDLLWAIPNGVGKVFAMVALRAGPEVAQTMVREGIDASKPGVRRLFARMEDVSRQTRGLMLRLTAKGARIDTKVLADRIGKAVEADLGKSSTSSDKLEALDAIYKRFVDDNGTHLNPVKAWGFGKSARKQAEGQFVRLADGQMMQLASDPVEQLWKLHEYRLIGELLEAGTKVRDPKTGQVLSRFKELNRLQSELIALKNILAPEVKKEIGTGARAVRGALSPIGRLATGATLGAALPGGNNQQQAVLGAGLAGALGSPALMSRLALLLSSPLLGNMLRQTPRVGMMAAHE